MERIEMSAPYWPNNPTPGFQQLTYISSSQTLGITPAGNTVQLNLGGGSGTNGVFSTLSVFQSLSLGDAGVPGASVNVGVDGGNNTNIFMTGAAGTVPNFTLQPSGGTDYAQLNYSASTLTARYYDGATDSGSISIAPSFPGATTAGGVKLADQNQTVKLYVADGLVTATTQVNAPTLSTVALQCSTINGAFSPAKQVGWLSPIVTVPGTATSTIINAYPCDPTHTYRISYEADFSNANPAGLGITDMYVDSQNYYIGTVQNSVAQASFNFARQSFNCVFRPSGATFTVTASNSSAFPTDISNNHSGTAFLEDLGVTA